MRFFRIAYDDGDTEDMTCVEVRRGIRLHREASACGRYMKRGQLVTVVNGENEGEVYFKILWNQRLVKLMKTYAAVKSVFVGSLEFKCGDVTLTGDETLREVLGEREVWCVKITVALK